MRKLLTLAVLLPAAITYGQSIISVNFSNGQALSGPAGLASAGTVVDISGWAQTTGFGSALGTTWENGTTSNVILDNTAGSSGGMNQFFGPSYASNSGRLLNGAAMDYLPTDATPDVSQAMTFSGMNTDFGGGYYAIVYLNGFAGNTGNSISDGSTTYYWTNLADNGSYDGTLVQTLDTADDSNYAVAQYAMFGSEASPLTADTLTLTYQVLGGGGAGVAGVQLVAVPEPGTFALMTGLFTLGLLVYRRRKA